jgi:nucleoside-diphosphate-sugar epimerase
MKRIVIVGASGLVGSEFTERLLGRRDVEVVPLIHSSGSAWRLARRALPLRQVDLLDPAQTTAALAGATHVVNCSRGNDAVMIDGFGNLLRAARAAGVRKFVHLSSVAVYGDPPPPEAGVETAPTRPAPGSYGATKLRQDELLQRAAREGLPAVALCPPNIGGPYAYFHLQLADGLRQGTLALVDGGTTPCNTVDVGTLAWTMEQALDADVGDGRRVFVLDDGLLSWADAFAALQAELAGLKAPRAVTAGEVRRRTAEPVPSIASSLLRPLSGDVREALRRDRRWAAMEAAAKGLVLRLPAGAKDFLRERFASPPDVPHWNPDGRLAWRALAQQLRTVRHDAAQARRLFGPPPALTARGSIARFAGWYRRMIEPSGDYELIRHIE